MQQGQDLTKGTIRKELWSLAWPMMLSVFFYTLYNLVDAFWVGKLSAESIAAVSISQLTLFMMVALSMGITVGSGVLMAMQIGAKNKPEAERLLGQSFVLAAIAAGFFTTVSLIFRDQMLVLSGASGTIFAPALEYFTITSAGSVLFFILMTIMFAFNAQGDTFTLTKLFAFSTLVNVIFDPILIFGLFGFPALGIGGAAYATLISQTAFIVVALKVLSSEKRMVRFRFKNLTIRWESVKKVLKIGIPASLTQVLNPVGTAALLYITSMGFAEKGTIAFTIGSRVEFLGFLPAVGFGFAGLALIGQNMGAGNFKRAREAFQTALQYAVVAAASLGVLAAIFAGVITRTFTSDASVTGYAMSYIWVVSLSYGFLAAMMVEANAFQAIGRSWPGFWIVFLRFVGISIPLSLLLTQVWDVGIMGIWTAIILGNVVASIVGYFWITRALNKVNMKEVPVHVASH